MTVYVSISCNGFAANGALCSAVVQITIVVMIGVMIGAMTGIGMTVTGIAAIAPGLLNVGAIMKIVVNPGLHHPEGRMIEGLQGTMITGGVAMMIAEGLICIMTVVGMIKTEDATKEDATIKKIDMKKDQDRRTVKDGLVEGFCVVSQTWKN